ncbi:MAG: 4-hydroxy-tetrahydrodipicolinate synthase [Firmicutes bacterium]|jgi:4-hydroxy-2-oxoglutarate aldolase|nr:4-hydroxy-tetrahydrodipicolinate synthase [Bacillota bacterium]
MISGVFAPIATPFNKDGNIYWDKLKFNLDKWSRSGLSGLVVLGSNGEFQLLSRQEKEELIGFVRENTPKELKVIAGTGCESTRETIDLSKKAADLGADAVLVVTPNYYKACYTPAALKAHFEAVADACPIPVMLYNMPGNTGINMTSDLIAELASHPNIVGEKDSSGNITQVSETISKTSPDFTVFAGSASWLLPALCVGAKGGTVALANVLPEQCVAIYNYFQAGQLEEARKIQLNVLEINKAVTARWGPAGLKAAMDIVGYYGGPPRLPIQPLTAAQLEELKGILQRGKFI